MMSLLKQLSQNFQASLNDSGVLFVRVWVGYEFGAAGWIKLQDLSPPSWFIHLHFPFPHALLSPSINWGVAGLLESLLGLALILGVFSRLASWGLIYVTYVAIYSVHFDLGWAGWNQIETDQGLGFKVPLMLGLMLFTIISQGPGRFSIDHLCAHRTHLTD
jgi:putative oxidoreductase